MPGALTCVNIRPMLRILLTIGLFAVLPVFAAAQTRVIDGDTLELGGTVYRLNGIDAPEFGQTCGRWRCGAEATEALKKAVSGKSLRCEALSRDGYGRVIATCFANGQDIGAKMVADGFAWAFVRYSDAYTDQEVTAKAKSLGIWSGNYEPAWDFRASRWQQAQQAAPKGCPIKGNITKNGRIYHPPWSPWYAKTRIDTSKGERWFCTEAEALAAGWRAPRWN